MSREIKFRVWGKTEKEYIRYPFAWLSLFDSPDGLEIEENEDLVIEQYTGLKDKNGKEIYEGDIVKDDSGRKGKVYFDEGKLAYLFSDPHSWNQWWLRSEFGEHEVIGNIHENPELLGGEE